MTQQQSAELRLKKLRALVEYHRTQYHTYDTPEISDEAYDALVAELKALEHTLEGGVTTADSIGGAINTAFQKVTHAVPQWSFDNLFNYQELLDWQERAVRLLREIDITPSFSYVVEHKIDGLKLILTYERGRLKSAVTRGDGVVGEDVTHTATTIDTVPTQLAYPVDVVVVGEVVMYRVEFERVNAEREKVGEALFANPRNAAAGSLRQLDPAITRARKLTFIAYDIDAFVGHHSSVSAPASQWEEHQLLRQLGFFTSDDIAKVDTVDQIEAYYQALVLSRHNLPYDIDGVVIKINELSIQRELGYTAKGPRFGVAYKLPAEQTTTIVEAIAMQVGRTGVVTPVAHLRPVKIAGSVVARATLHNEDHIKRLDIRVGDTVVLQKAGDVIPEIVTVLKELRPYRAKPFRFPTHVSGCGGDGRIERIPGQAAHRCVVLESPLTQRRALYYAVSKVALAIDGCGPKIIDKLLDAGLITTLPDLFTLRLDDITQLPGFKAQSAHNLYTAIENARHQPLERVIIALGIPQVGEETARLITQHVTSLKDFMCFPVSELATIHGIGEVIATEIERWRAVPAHQELVTALATHLVIVSPDTKSKGDALRGEVVVVTGTLVSLSRDEVKEVIRRAGGKVANQVTRQTTLVVVGTNPGSKLAEAKKLAIACITEEELLVRLAPNKT